MPDATITSTASTFGTISGTFAADQSTVTGTISGTVTGTLTGSVGVPGPAGPGVPAGGTAGQYLQKIDGVDYNTDWVTLNLSAYAPLNSPVFTGDPQAPTPTFGDNDTSIATTAFVQAGLLGGTANAKNLEVYVRNQSGTTIPAGSIVYISGATGNRPLITLAQANNDANSAQTMGFTKTSIANNGFGYVIVRGELENIDTSALTEGVQLYLSPTTAGTWTTTKPSAPQHLVYVGIVVRAHPTQGVILVAVQNGYELNELHDVSITSPTNGQVLKYNSSTNLWVNGTDSSGVAWGAITGTLSSQTDLQTALDGKYSTSNPAGYITSSALTGYATESWVTAGFYPLTGNPSGFITSSALTPYAPLAGATFTGKVNFKAGTTSSASINLAPGVAPTSPSTGDVWFESSSSKVVFRSSALTQNIASELWVTSQSYITASALAGYATESWVTAGFYPLTGNPSGFITSSALTGYATESWVTSQGYLTSASLSGYATESWVTTQLGSYLTTSAASSTYLTQSNAASTYQTQAAMSSYPTISYANATYAPLASPALTGNPTAPTPATGDDDTSIATTAFVKAQGYLTTAPVTSVAGKTGAVTLVVGDVSGAAPLASPALTGTPTAPTATLGTNTTQIATTAFVLANAPSTSFATDAQVVTGTSTTTALYPGHAGFLKADPRLRSLAHISYTRIQGSGAATSGSVSFGIREMYLGSLATGLAGFSYGWTGQATNNMSAADWTKVNFSKKIWMSGVAMCGSTIGGTNYIGDSNTRNRVTLGGYTSDIVSGDMTVKGIGWKKVGGTSSFFTLTVHNGTTLTDVATTVTQSAGKVINWVIYSDGTGNVTLYIDGTQVATTSAGPTGTSNSNQATYREQVEAVATPTVRAVMECTGGWIYLAD